MGTDDNNRLPPGNSGPGDNKGQSLQMAGEDKLWPVVKGLLSNKRICLAVTILAVLLIGVGLGVGVAIGGRNTTSQTDLCIAGEITVYVLINLALS